MSEQTCGHSNEIPTASTSQRRCFVSYSHFRRRINFGGKRRSSRVGRCVLLTSSTTNMSFLPPPPPGMPGPPPGMPPPPPGMPPVAQGDPSSSRLPPEVLALKSQKWIQMQKKRYGQKRKGGYIDMGKQVRQTNSCFFSDLLPVCCIGYAS